MEAEAAPALRWVCLAPVTVGCSTAADAADGEEAGSTLRWDRTSSCIKGRNRGGVGIIKRERQETPVRRTQLNKGFAREKPTYVSSVKRRRHERPMLGWVAAESQGARELPVEIKLGG